MSDLTQEQKDKAIELALSVANKEFGKGSLYVYGDHEPEPIPVIPTGSIHLNRALGVGGFPRGRIVEILGPESSGKTTVALHAIAQAQKAGGTCAFIDAEHALDIKYAQALGVEVKDLILSQPSTGEEALRLVELMVRSNAADLVVIDSVAALVPRAELEGSIGDSHMGLQARLMSQAMRMLAGVTEKSGTTLIFINQIRMKLGVLFGSPETTSGGNALKFYASVRLDIRRKGSIKQGEEIIGNEVDIKVIKNKVAAPFKVASTRIMYGRGFHRAWELLEEGEAMGAIEKSGSWYSMDLGEGEPLRLQGEANLVAHLDQNPDVMARLEALVR